MESGCAEFASCRWGRERAPSPAGELACTRDYDQSVEKPSALRDLANCWQASCVDACQLGRLWECSGNYVNAPPDRAARITVNQVLHWLNTNEPVIGASVRFCEGLTALADCGFRADGQAITNCSGIAQVELPIPTDDRPGWSGYRQVELEGTTVRLQNNLAVTLSRYSLQHVPHASQVRGLTGLFGGSLELGNVVFQVFDCAHTGAEGAVVEVQREGGTESVGMVGYLRGEALSVHLEPGATSAQNDGGGAILNLPVNEWLWVTVRQGSGTEIARTRIFTQPGELLLVELHPGPKEL
jgi:hypothetical protein